MNIGIDLITENIGMSFESTILFIAVVGGIIFYALNFKTGIVLHFFITSGIFMWFFQAGYNYVAALVVCLIFLVLMCFSLYSISQTSQSGGAVI